MASPYLKTLSAGLYKDKPVITPSLKMLSFGMRLDTPMVYTLGRPAKQLRRKTVEGKHLRGDAVLMKSLIHATGLVGNASVSTINGLTPATGDSYVVTDAGTLTEGSLAVSIGDTVQYQTDEWVLIRAGSGGYVPSGFRVLMSSQTSLIDPYVNLHHTNRIMEFDGESNTAYDAMESEPGAMVIIDPSGSDMEAGSLFTLSDRPPEGSWTRGDNVVGVTAADTNADFLASKVTAGSGIVLATVNPGGNESLQISAPNAVYDEKVAAASGNNSAYLQDALEAGSNITLTLSGASPNQKVRIASTAAAGSGGGTAWYQEFTASASQTLFNLSSAYVIGTNSLFVFINGNLVAKDLYSETSTTSFTLTGWPALVGGEKVIAFVPRGDGKSLVSSGDTTYGYLQGKIVAGTGITLTKQNSGADENLRIDTAGGGVLLAVWPAAQNGFLSSPTKLIDAAALPSACTALRIACNSQSCGNASHTNGNHIYLRGANTVHGAWSYTSSYGAGNSSQTYSGGVYTNYYLNVWMYVSSWSPLTIWTVAISSSGAHHVVVEVLG